MTFASELTRQQTQALVELRADLYRLRDDFDVPAMAVIIVSSSDVLLNDVSGLADRARGKPATRETVFRIGSITKMFTSLAMLILQQQGLLDLDMKVTEISPDIPLENKWRASHPVRIAHLLEHTAGLLDLSKDEFDQNTPMPLEQALAWKAGDRITQWPPGEHYSYTNVGAGLAAYVIEKVSKQRFESVIEQHIFSPLGMSSASLSNDEQTLAQLATGYDTDAQRFIPYWHVLYRAFGAINLKPADMVPFLQLLLNKGTHAGQRLIAEDAILRMETPTTSLAAQSGLRYGYGLGNYTWLSHGLLFHGHGGDADGYLARLAYNRDTQLGYFVVINTFQNTALSALQDRIEAFISRDQEVPVVVPYRISEEILNRYSGDYRRITRRFLWQGSEQETLTISKQDGGLRIEVNGTVKQLLPVNDRHFRYRDENQATSSFVTDESGQLFFQSDDGSFAKD
jgi:CubicO group peptidase (beta-lactamase class C family)